MPIVRSLFLPEVVFVLEWPDGERSTCYSPSSVVREHLKAGTRYSVTELLAICAIALGLASDRVEEVYGYRCTSAEQQLRDIQLRAGRFAGADIVTVLEVG